MTYPLPDGAAVVLVLVAMDTVSTCQHTDKDTLTNVNERSVGLSVSDSPVRNHVSEQPHRTERCLTWSETLGLLGNVSRSSLAPSIMAAEGDAEGMRRRRRAVWVPGEKPSGAASFKFTQSRRT